MKSYLFIFPGRWICTASLIIGSCLVHDRALAEQAATEEVQPSTAAATKLIGELNQMAVSPDFVAIPTVTDNEAAIELTRKCWAIRGELAAEGVCLRYKDGAFVHATRDALNGHKLKPDELRSLALLNYCEQLERATKQAKKGYKGSGEAWSRIDSLKSDLARRGVSIEWNGDLFVVQSVRTNPGTAADAAGQQTNLMPTNASTPSP